MGKNNSYIRTFIAVKVDDPIREGFVHIQNELNSVSPYVRWVRPTSVHITLKFLGNTPLSVLENIMSNLSDAIEGINPFTLEIKGLGVFPSLTRPRVIWVGIQNSNTLQLIKEKVEALISPLGFPTERRKFAPHLTIARVKSHQSEVGTVVKHYIPIFENTYSWILDVQDVYFIKSTLHPKGAQYEDILGVNLRQ